MIGYDNREFDRALHPKLTIITQPTEEIAAQVAETMLSRLESGAQDAWKELYLQTEVMSGKSVKNLLI